MTAPGREERALALRTAEMPLVARLQEVDPSIDSVWDLVNQRKDVRPLLGPLLEWLPKTRNLDLIEAISRALTDPRARPIAARPLIDAFRAIPIEAWQASSVKWAIANGLATVADASVFPDLVELATDRRHGTSREMLTYAIGRSKVPDASRVLLDLLDDPDVSGHAIVALATLAPPEGRARIEPFVQDRRAWVRRAATRALFKIDQKTSAA